MKNRASVFLKQIISVITTIVKAKSLAIKSKTSAMKTRLIIFSLLKNKKVLLASISHKLHALTAQQDKRQDKDEMDDQSQATIEFNSRANEVHPNPSCTELVKVDGEEEEEEDEDDKYPDLTHSLLEDEIDHVADLFIKRFHRQMKMQKQESFKRYQEMLERSV
uniref:Uncharacterized protein n=1 Tax=Nelumbo nucifera TaxID=4432 RepID=A0A822YIK8_NELNU|nr:TPA_asm: hypothetical protein HUJ06_004674 [Nelumbo nucifera]